LMCRCGLDLFSMLELLAPEEALAEPY
jgi:hypothetical protein